MFYSTDDKRQFLIHADVETFELPYDYQSVMHYPITAFAVDTNLPTIVPKAKGARIGDSKYLTPNDVVKLQKTYKCYPGPDETDEDERPTTTQEPGRISIPAFCRRRVVAVSLVSVPLSINGVILAFGLYSV